MDQSMIGEPTILVVVQKIVKRNTPIIVARAFSKYLDDKFKNNVTEEIRKEARFDESLHRRLFHKNQALNECNCVHCRAREEYVRTKLAKHRVKRSLYSDVPFYDGEYEGIMSTLRILDDQIKHCKQNVLKYARRLEI